MFRCSASSPTSPVAKGGWLKILSHQFNDLARFQPKLNLDCIESRSILPSHLNNAICLSNAQINVTHASSLKLLSTAARRRVFPCRLQRSLQCFTSSQTLDHFFLQVIGRLQTEQVFSGKFSFLISRGSLIKIFQIT